MKRTTTRRKEPQMGVLRRQLHGAGGKGKTEPLRQNSRKRASPEGKEHAKTYEQKTQESQAITTVGEQISGPHLALQ